MKRFYAFLVILLLSFCIYAQPPKDLSEIVASQKEDKPNADSKNESEGKKDGEGKKNAGVSKSKIVLPPEKANPVNIPLIVNAPVIDGKLDDEIWKTAAVFKDFYQIAPGDNIAPSKPTEVYLTYDEKNLYIAFKCWDDPSKIRATVAKRDAVTGEDNVRVWLDTYNDQRRAYFLAWNPLGIQQDGIFTEGQGTDFSIDIIMESKGVIEEWGWSVEVKIPFKSLRYTAGKGKLWGFNAARNIDRFNDELDAWMPDDRNITGQLIEYGKITGLDHIKTERTLEIVPSITLSETGSRKRTLYQSFVNNLPPGAVIDRGRFFNDGLDQDIGVNLKYSITPNITLDAAYNPDFAEIEADAPVIAANQRFPIFFVEKRPFFLEGAEIFKAPLQTFYSRTIVDPDIAAKLTGKVGRNSFGFLVASDNAPGNYSDEDRNDPGIRPGIEEFLDKNAFFSVLRLKRDVGKENSIGFFGTMRTFPKQKNYTGGFDGRFTLNAKTIMQFQVIGTNSQRYFYNPETNSSEYRTGNGLGYYWSLDYTEKNRGFYIETVGRSRDYRADAGFTRRTNTNSIFLAGRFSTDPKPNAKIIRFDWRPAARINYDWKGRSTDGGLSSSFNFSLQHNTNINAEVGVAYERLFEEEFGPKRTLNHSGAFVGAPERSTYQPYFSINANRTINKKLSVYGFVGTIFSAYDYDFGSGGRFPRVSRAYLDYLNSPEYLEFLRIRAINPSDPLNFPPDEPFLDPGTGRQFDLNLGFEYKPVDPLRVSLDYTKSKLTRYDTGEKAFDADVVTLRSTYQFTRFIFARTRVDYDSLSSNFSGQMLFGWNPTPGTAFYVGYNDNFNYNGYNPYTGQFEPRFERNARTFFIRASYLFRKSF